MKEKLYSFLDHAYRFVFNLEEDERVSPIQKAGMAVVFILLFAIFAVVKI